MRWRAVFVGQERDPRLVLAVILVVAGVAFKIAAVPFHMWAPDVYEGAPTPITAFLSVGSKAASFAMLLRIFIEGLPAMSADWRLLFEALAIVTMTVGNVAALTQSNIKRMLAYSSIAHAGYILIGVVAGTTRGVSAILIYLFVYAFMQLGAFTVIVLLRRRDVVGDELRDFSGLSFRQPAAAFAMLLFMLSLGGIPPTAGFMGKLWLFGAAIDSGYVWLAVIGVLNSAISLYYYIRVVVFMYLEEGSDRIRADQQSRAHLGAGGGRRGHARPGDVPEAAVCGGRGRVAVDGRGRSGGGAAIIPAGEVFHKVRYTARLGDNGFVMPQDKRLQILERSAKSFQEQAEQAGPAAGASYGLIGAIILLGGIGYGIDRWLGSSPWGLLIGLALGLVVGFYGLARMVWRW